MNINIYTYVKHKTQGKLFWQKQTSSVQQHWPFKHAFPKKNASFWCNHKVSTWAACAQCPHLLLRVNNYFDFDSYLCLYLLHVFDKLVKNCNHKGSTWAEYSQSFSMCTSEHSGTPPEKKNVFFRALPELPPPSPSTPPARRRSSIGQSSTSQS